MMKSKTAAHVESTPFASRMLVTILYLAIIAISVGCMATVPVNRVEPMSAKTSAKVELDQLRPTDFSIFGGSYHAQKQSGFRPRKDVAAVPLVPPIDWDMDPFKDANWRFQLSAWRMLNPVWSKWYGKDWARLEEEVLPWIEDWSRYHLDEKRVSAFEWYDMATGLRAQNLAMLLWLQDQGKLRFNQKQMSTLHRLAVEHVEKLRDPAFINSGNHGIFQIQGLRLLCITSQIPECAGEERYSSTMMSRLFDSQFDARGVQTENSPSYHIFSLNAFNKIRTPLYPSIATHFKDVLSKAALIAPWFTEPDGRIVQIGDSEGKGVKKSLATMVHSSPFAKEDGQAVVADLHESGYFIVRSLPGVDASKAFMLVVSGVTSRTKVHDHADELSFVLFSTGRRLFVDSGKFTYNKNAWRSYFVSDRAHNVVGVEGASFAPGDTLETASTLKSVSTRAGHYEVAGCVHRGPSFEYCRRYTYQPGKELVVMDDIKSLPGAGRPAIYWHLAPGLVAKSGPGGFTVDSEAGVPVARISVEEPGCSATIISGATAPEIQGWVSQEYKHKEKADVIKYVCSHRTKKVVTRINLDFK